MTDGRTAEMVAITGVADAPQPVRATKAGTEPRLYNRPDPTLVFAPQPMPPTQAGRVPRLYKPRGPAPQSISRLFATDKKARAPELAE
jgi:hypothetical protein